MNDRDARTARLGRKRQFHVANGGITSSGGGSRPNPNNSSRRGGNQGNNNNSSGSGGGQRGIAPLPLSACTPMSTGRGIKSKESSPTPIYWRPSDTGSPGGVGISTSASAGASAGASSSSSNGASSRRVQSMLSRTMVDLSGHSDPHLGQSWKTMTRYQQVRVCV
jgi:hypothetical protein